MSITLNPTSPRSYLRSYLCLAASLILHDAFVAADSLSFAVSSGATASTSITPTIASVDGYAYMGCYHDSEGDHRGLGRVLGNMTVTYSNMDVSACEDYCGSGSVDAPWNLFGLETGTECWCGDTLNLGSKNFKADDANCDYACGDDPSDVCGGSWYINVWSTTAPPSSTMPNASATTTTGGRNGAAPAKVTASKTSETAAAASTSASKPSTNNVGGSGVSGGTIAAAVIAGLLGIALILVAILFLLQRNKRKNQGAQGPEVGQYPQYGHSGYQPAPVVEADTISGRSPHELEANKPPA